MKKRPPYIKLYVRDFAFDVQDMSNEQLGAYFRSFLKAYKTGNIPNKYASDFLFKSLQESSEQYLGICTRNKINGTKPKTYRSQPQASRKPNEATLVNQEPITKNHKPTTNNQEPPKKPSEEAHSKKTTTHSDIIKSFDKAIVTAYGKEYERICPTSTDKLTAKEWNDKGITTDFLDEWLTSQMKAMSEKGRSCPTCLKFFSSSVAQAFAEWKGVPDEKLSEEQQREKYYKETGKWLSIWGSAPDDLQKEASNG